MKATSHNMILQIFSLHFSATILTGQASFSTKLGIMQSWSIIMFFATESALETIFLIMSIGSIDSWINLRNIRVFMSSFTLVGCGRLVKQSTVKAQSFLGLNGSRVLWCRILETVESFGNWLAQISKLAFGNHEILVDFNQRLVCPPRHAKLIIDQ